MNFLMEEEGTVIKLWEKIIRDGTMGKLFRMDILA
jgi:hypothetical protein